MGSLDPKGASRPASYPPPSSLAPVLVPRHLAAMPAPSLVAGSSLGQPPLMHAAVLRMAGAMESTNRIVTGSCASGNDTDHPANS